MYRYLIVAFVLLLGCSKKDEQPAPPTESTPPAPATADTATAAEEARNTFNTLCSTCHGQSGKGDGIAAASLDPKPRNYTDKAWQASITDEQIKNTIVKGGAAVGKSALMPPNPQLESKPEVVNELVKIVRSFGQ
jgi:cytochrome c553